MAKKPAPTKASAARALAQPPHPLAGYYVDKVGGKFWVATQPTFALFRCNAEWGPVDPDSPIQNDAEQFEKALRMGTFTRINH